MGTPFFLLMGILALISGVNFISALAQRKSRLRTFGIWFNGIAFTLIAVAIFLGFFTCK